MILFASFNLFDSQIYCHRTPKPILKTTPILYNTDVSNITFLFIYTYTKKETRHVHFVS